MLARYGFKVRHPGAHSDVRQNPSFIVVVSESHSRSYRDSILIYPRATRHRILNQSRESTLTPCNHFD